MLQLETQQIQEMIRDDTRHVVFIIDKLFGYIVLYLYEGIQISYMYKMLEHNIMYGSCKK